MNDDTHPLKPRAMHGFSIPAYTYKSCACGQIWIGPAYTCIDDSGFFWNCPGCEHRFKSDGNYLEGDHPANDI